MKYSTCFVANEKAALELYQYSKTALYVKTDVLQTAS